MARSKAALPLLVGIGAAAIVMGRRGAPAVAPTSAKELKPGPDGQPQAPAPTPTKPPSGAPGVTEFDHCRWVIERQSLTGSVQQQQMIFEGSQVEFNDGPGISGAQSAAQAAEEQRQAETPGIVTPGKWVLTRTCEVIGPDGTIDTVRMTATTLMVVSP